MNKEHFYLILWIFVIVMAFAIGIHNEKINDLERKQQVIYEGLCEDEINMTIFSECLSLFPEPERSLESVWVNCELKATKQKCPKGIK